MSIINATPLLAAAGGDYQISRSVRLRSSASGYFSRTFSNAATNNLKGSLSIWTKRGTLGAQVDLISCYNGSSSASTDLYFNTSNQLQFDYGNTAANSLITTAVYRDPSAWYHIHLEVDTTQATASNRVKLYVNGVQVTAFGTANYPAQNTVFQIVSVNANNRIGTNWNNSGAFFDGYLTEVNFIDGQALTPSSFGETDSITGVWKPKKYAGTYGTNGFYLNFSDNSSNTATTIGKDYSGNGNNWTPNNISVTAGVTYDSMLDVPTMWADGGNGRGNYAVMNPLLGGVNNAVMTNGNLTATLTATSQVNCHSTIPIPTTGKWYAEVQVVTASSYGVAIGIERQPFNAASGIFASNGIGYYNANGNKYVLGTASAYGSSWFGARTDLIGISVDMDSGSVHFYLNGVDQGAISFTTGDDWFFGGTHGSGSGSHTENWNFGQRPFAYTPPTGFKALNTQNLPDSTIKKGNQYFDATLYSGNNSTQTVVNSGAMQPDLVWIKSRSAATSNDLFDSVRGAMLGLTSNATSTEGTWSGVTAFNSNGFTLGANTSDNASGASYAAWQWKESVTAGFDIVTYTGNQTAGKAVPHSLGVAPAMIIVKARGQATSWPVYHQSLGATKWLLLNSTQAVTTTAQEWDNQPPSSTNFYVGNSSSNSNQSTTYVAYLFSEVAGYSKFGSYTGNGSADGPFIYCGFRPRFVMIKRTDTTQDWMMIDTARDQYNVSKTVLAANSSLAESSFGSGYDIDILSNGFKFRNSVYNAGSGIYAAFAENPFKNSLAR